MDATEASPIAAPGLARKIGLAAALGTRLVLLFTLTFFLGLTAPVFTLPDLPFLHDLEAREVSWRDLILLAGGLFLVCKSVFEMHERLEHAKAAAATNGEVTLRGARADQMHAVLDKLHDAGVKVESRGTSLTFSRNGRLKPVDITTLPYAGFPTDAQAQMMVLMTLTPGISIITERIFESRFMHVSELARLGAEISIEGPSAIVKGGKKLSGAPVMASDLRASAALVIAGLAARGATQVNRVYHLDRGYEDIDGKLRRLGARIERVEES